MFGKKYFGFTLSEVLITLGLIGVVSALTIPNLAFNYRAKVLEEQFRGTYSDIRQIGAMINLEKGDVGAYALKASLANWEKEVMSRVNGGNILVKDPGYEQLTKELKKIYKSAGTNGPYSFPLTNGKKVNATMLCDNGSIHSDSKGRLWFFNSESRIVCVDINGTANPNRYNIDIFAFIPMPAPIVGTWVYDDRTHPNNYTGAIILCDIEKLLRISIKKGTDDEGKDVYTSLSNIIAVKDTDGFYTAHKDNPQVAYDACPFNEPIENIAVVNPTTKKGTSARGKQVTTSNSYWKDYINYR